MALSCSDPLEGYFDDITPRGAVFAHRNHLQIQTKSTPIDATTQLDRAVLTITLEYGVVRLYPVGSDYDIRAVICDNTPMPESLSSYQTALLEAEEWDAFWSELRAEELCDIIVYQNQTMIARVLLSLKGGVVASRQINVGGKVYVDDTMIEKCPWTRESIIDCAFTAHPSLAGRH
tara:strand:- start:778 stop:1305 length:528 start_codon:yes stop_codon:yes gene_type:complete